ncbi:hypothetical protein [Aurantimonas sp. Leaf443]|uniref:hypothetical protein n=1 Tax=Aurantimonas sp. Leaf443 TaxID=1736378 RepID=UPI0006F78EAA|nr:hypothetical protein [Aurantimonas sp. Leaf443]KQT87999.1 hypothetical protein ASG48_00630 [Aurantimonas sp. Leaf443]
MSRTGERTITVPDLERNVPAALLSVSAGPLLVTEHGRPAFVLLSHAAYVALCGPAFAPPGDDLTDDALTDNGRAEPFTPAR